MVPAVAACQSLTRYYSCCSLFIVDDYLIFFNNFVSIFYCRIEGELTGDPMDLVLFRKTNFEMHEPSSNTITGSDCFS